MKYLCGFLNILWRIWFLLLASIYIIPIGLFIVLPLSFSNSTYPIAYRFIQFWGTFMFYGMGFRDDYSSKEELDPNQTYIFIANHTSIVDVLLMLHILKKHPIVFVGKAELSRIPIFGLIYKRICIPVDRSNIKSRANVYPEAKERLANGLSIFIFPEGGVPDDMSIDLDNFKDGAFSIAIETQTPVAVFTICGLKKMFPFDYFHGYPGKVHVKLSAIVHPKGYNHSTKDQLKQKCHQLLWQDLQNCRQ
ncbi:MULTISPECIES: lysophospholipid acyltransferase family protein [Weeksella]|uniref:Phospholipid/glycerol acyltransferase n=1 Tax=Weeksella virosa (strain ATCC 43766 / DSM 16922 / JCM 21250 / CCUG 30538 / CDC 9751 / IAM 14551 / NBRC 16016 / NCTC 11634 / CL345/78) TaxID=865938 RepID=F0P164_WEEVC|nr:MULTISPECIES: lysophospholipid acyltransferase family protein [Weeksella]ADX67563.1 phospholipid/glycerol acyltransferase [Weeksella virosa DSM 16922]MDK7375329.1 lysophospholipid acyltransferase family protein [Weeksella virosa]MDK7676063.1 lysophospholipid acyltransferase family protein [Weeksella virosa]OFM84774.1 glycerol acyltransferase [Weeksella sp. HMSC059D05]SUP53858.1 1-acyl-sn-glycerol-3-phosphate acyltransferase [Weeksella virosa]